MGQTDLLFIDNVAPKVEDIENQTGFRQILAISYGDLVDFVLHHVKKPTLPIITFWLFCLIFLGTAIIIRLNISVSLLDRYIFLHSVLGLTVFPVLIIPLHEMMHAISFFIAGARKIKMGIDLKQYIFYVTAHRHVVSSGWFRLIALSPFISLSLLLVTMVLLLPGSWKWSLSLSLFIHATMCAGDFAFLSFLWINRGKTILTWDDADREIAYFYEKSEPGMTAAAPKISP
jgi:hypothetical protein